MTRNIQTAERLDRALNRAFFFSENNITPLPFQLDLMELESDDYLILCSRRAGKTYSAAALACHRALNYADQDILFCSPTEQQAKETIRICKLLILGAKCGSEIRNFYNLEIQCKNGSRILGLQTQRPDNLRGKGANVIIFDEACSISDEAFATLLPVLSATERPKFVALTTAKGKSGWFYDLWTDEEEESVKIKLPATDCPHISKKFLEKAKKRMSPTTFAREYMCEFGQSQQPFIPEEILDQTFAPRGTIHNQGDAWRFKTSFTAMTY